VDSNLGHNVGHALALDCGCAMNHIMCLNSNENYMEVLTYNTEHVKGFSSAEDSSGFLKISLNSYQANSTRSFGMNQMLKTSGGMSSHVLLYVPHCCTSHMSPGMITWWFSSSSMTVFVCSAGRQGESEWKVWQRCIDSSMWGMRSGSHYLKHFVSFKGHDL
jgi:hypothetical protein